MKNPLESYIQKTVRAYAKSKGVLSYKFSSPSQRHIPDCIFIHAGRTFYVEFKRLGEKPTLAQALEHERMRAHGAIVHVCDSVESGKRIVDKEVEGEKCIVCGAAPFQCGHGDFENIPEL